MLNRGLNQLARIDAKRARKSIERKELLGKKIGGFFKSLASGEMTLLQGKLFNYEKSSKIKSEEMSVRSSEKKKKLCESEQGVGHKRKFGGKTFTLMDETDGFRYAEDLAKKLRKEGYHVRVLLHRYSPLRGAEYNMYKVWARKK
jgi:hypothetical protein